MILLQRLDERSQHDQSPKSFEKKNMVKVYNIEHNFIKNIIIAVIH